ncbi:MAG: septal ring lytic transglycosylase RlpA family protein [Gammaproteobacteria bacterium]|jgi:rare lipoprotein A|nr:septal ring lytic transglycosylase RlpA family protein [Gammaproteobacteria bacterium]MDH3934047.1 septal ring lytic transglycosylase RlpA family protein [Gammaproteobacteria bacterium]MDH3985115.1 septal ring lytic transglycosylase RlpA family protein [Gammaproteobacteria bacterium]
MREKMKIPGLMFMLLFMSLAVNTAMAMDAQEGEASYYADTLDGNKTASGAVYDKDALTAAHRTLPFGTRVKVTYLKTGNSVEVVINDRGPRAKSRIIDLSGAAASKVGMIDDGHGKVKLEVLE